MQSKIKYKIILNPKAAGGKAKSIAAEILEKFGKYGHVDLYETCCKGDATQEAKNAVGKYDVVVAAGGDGTINEVINGIAYQNIKLGIVPVGTANVFALEHDVKNMNTAIERVITGTPKTIDLGKIEGQYFLSWAGIGLDAHTIKTAESEKYYLFYKKILGIHYYTLSCLKAFTNYDPSILEIKVDGVSYLGYNAVISNIKYYGTKLFMLAPAAKVDDGLLDVIICKNKKIKDMIKHAPGTIMNGKHTQSEDIIYVQGKSIEINSEKPVSSHCDAELYKNTPLKIRVAEKAIEIII